MDDTLPISGDICRVCRLASTPDRPLFHPCRCTGSIRYVHQDCLMQWLGHSGKQYCELCHYKFQFASVYRHDMPRWLPFKDLYQSLFQGSTKKIQKWLHLGFVMFVWICMVPVIVCRLYKVLFHGSLFAVLTLPIDILSLENIVFDFFTGLLLVVISLLTFISLVWLRDQLNNGGGPAWLIEDFQELQKMKNEAAEAAVAARKKRDQETSSRARERHISPERMNTARHIIRIQEYIDNLTKDLETALQRSFEKDIMDMFLQEMALLYDIQMPVTHYMPLLANARTLNQAAVDKWFEGIMDELRAAGKILPHIKGCPPAAAIKMRETALPSLADRGLSIKQSAAFELFDRLPTTATTEKEKYSMESQLLNNRKHLHNYSQIYISHLKDVTHVLIANENESLLDSLSIEEKRIIKDIWHFQSLLESSREHERKLMREQNKTDRQLHPMQHQRPNNRWHERVRNIHLPLLPPQQEQQDMNNRRRRRNNPPARPNIGQALIGLAREPQDPNAEIVQADQLTKMLGLDGSFHFLEHVMWLIILITLLIVVFAYVPFKIGSVILWIFQLFGMKLHSKYLYGIVLGYTAVFLAVLVGYYVGKLVKVPRINAVFGVAFLVLKIAVLLILEAGVFPLLCGWWIDICSFALLGSTINDRKQSLNDAFGTVFFLHWLAGMIFIFYFASFVVLLREILRPGVLWFLRNLNDPNFHPIQDMMTQPFQRHFKRFLMSNMMFGITIMVVLLIPSRIVTLIIPNFLPFNLTLISSVTPVREVQLELILLQFVIPTFLEHSNSRAVIKSVVKHWAHFTSKLIGLQSYLLDGSQTGGAVIDMHGTVIQILPHDPSHVGPVYDGATQSMGPGFAPFKPYLRPPYFFIRVAIFVISTTMAIVAVSTLILVLPVGIGRTLMELLGVQSAPDIYTIAVGLYILWLVGRCVRAVAVSTRTGLEALLKMWILQGCKCAIAGVLLFIIIPLLLGHLVNLIFISPLRVPLNKTPVFYQSTEWALGLLHMKCTCGIIWLTDTQFKRTLDAMYQRGIRNLDLLFVISAVAWPVVSKLFLFTALPYTLLMGFTFVYGNSITFYIVYRCFYPLLLVVVIFLTITLIAVKQAINVYTAVRNDRYLIGRQLVNYGTASMQERSVLVLPEQETGLP